MKAWAVSVLVAFAATGCDGASKADEALAAQIERQVVAAHPDLSLTRFARFYAHEPNGSVRAIYLFANEGHEPLAGKPGTSTWTSLDRLPVVYDGGCTVLTIKYDATRAQLIRVDCNAPG